MENKWWAAWAAPGVILAAAYLLWLYQRVFFGKNENPKNAKLLDLSAREMATFVPLVVLAFAIGLYPKPLFQILATPVNNLVATVRPDYPGVTKPVVAGEPQKTAQPDATTLLPEPSQVPAVKSPTTTGGAAGTGVTRKKQPAPVKTAQVNAAAAATAGGR
jgi:NADH-quinone oxidoreductase subunit M